MGKYFTTILLLSSLSISLCDGVQMDRDYYDAAYTYVDCCCFSLSKERFEAILQDDVQLFHQTNEDTSFIAHGKTTVVELFNTYVFENSSDIEVREVTLQGCEEGVFLRLLVEETKTANGGLSDRFLFEETTVFQFSDTKPYKIISIQMRVKKSPIVSGGYSR